MLPIYNIKLPGLSPNTNYEFSVAAYNSIGRGPFSPSTDFSTAAIMCGDGICDSNETCSSCLFDCSACGYRACPVGNNMLCNGRGTCFKGNCDCFASWFGDACQFSVEEVPPVVFLLGNPTVLTAELPVRSSQNISVSFGILFASIREIDENGGTVVSFDINLPNNTRNHHEKINSSNTKFIISLPNNANLAVKATVYNETTIVKFANESIRVPKNGLKYLIHIENWPFIALTHRLVVSMRVNASAKGASDGSCTRSQAGTKLRVNTDGDSSLSFIYFEYNGVLLYGTFLENAYLDDIYNIRLVRFYYNTTANTIDIEIPHFWDYVDIDPNFQVLLGDDCYFAGRKRNQLSIFILS
eukprot:Phypoly_transcript_05426.p1 GENE.Phypoly_transcript_05426~~Phypoly_transcript_05426.p1  ORF type:complete len:356 (+),score=25.74 Phypoly_transcript_05426:398-1465(+)